MTIIFLLFFDVGHKDGSLNLSLSFGKKMFCLQSGSVVWPTGSKPGSSTVLRTIQISAVLSLLISDLQTSSEGNTKLIKCWQSCLPFSVWIWLVIPPAKHFNLDPGSSTNVDTKLVKVQVVPWHSVLYWMMVVGNALMISSSFLPFVFLCCAVRSTWPQIAVKAWPSFSSSSRWVTCRRCSTWEVWVSPHYVSVSFLLLVLHLCSWLSQTEWFSHHHPQ